MLKINCLEHCLGLIRETPRFYASEERMKKNEAIEYLKFFNLENKINGVSKKLGLMENKRRLEIVRALALNLKIFILDEPAAGMNPQEKQLI